MRPLRIELSAFGPYPGIETVDFTRLASRGLYVITGPTGSGKTTVFDAMTFALYNTMAQKEPREIRSHHADPAVATWVRFEFELDGARYLVERSPQYERPRKHGTGTTKESPKASLVRIEPDGSTVSLAAKVNEVTERCTELIGLSAEQFQRVMLLPQGLVARFLLDASTEREALLAQLFGGEIYDRAVARLQADARERDGALRDSEETLRLHLATARAGLRRVLGVLGIEPHDDADEADADTIAAALVRTDDACAALERSAAANAETARTAERLLAQAREEATRFDRALQLRTELAARREAEPSVFADELTAISSQQARPVVLAADSSERAGVMAERSRLALDERCASIGDLAEQAGVTIEMRSAASILAGLTAASNEVRASLTLLDELDRLRRSVADRTATLSGQRSQLESGRASLAEMSSRLDQLRGELDEVSDQRPDLEALERESDRLDRARSERVGLTRDQARLGTIQLELDRRRAEQAETWRRFVATQAPRLAGDLRDGDPCPVCGSVEHPEPAVDHDGEAVPYEAVTAAAAAVEAVDEDVRQITQVVNERLVRLGDLAELTETELADRIDAHRRHTVDAHRVHSRFDELTHSVRSLDGEVTSLDRAMAALVATIEAGEATLVTAEAELVAADERCAGLDRDRISAAAALLARCHELADDLDAVFEAADRDATLAGEARARADTALADSRFATLAEAREALLDDAVERDRLAAAATHREAVNRATTALDTLLEQGVPDARPALDDLAAAADRARAEADRTAVAVKEVAIGRSDTADALGRYATDAERTATLREAALAAQRAYKVCSGQGTIKMSLRRWVLANELDRVTAAASVHLRRMTSGRYTIRRLLEARDAKSVFGLDLEILDAHTGRPRRPNSLSGGEQFQASLALALGLADVISHGGTASGRRMEVLFIDEGFGSLDPDALDDAIETLHQLRASGRTVGAITHVEAMKDRLHVGITVQHLETGRGSRVLVTP